jgi:hypothetical protein
MKNISKLIVIAFFCLSINACASGAQTEKMIAAPTASASNMASNKYFQSISLGNISGGKETNALWLSKVSNTAFRDALEGSLDAYGFLNKNNTSSYTLDAELLALEQPMIGLSFTVNSIAQYNLRNTSTNESLIDEAIEASGTATMGDAFIGTTRLKLANESAIKNNIQAFIDKLQ